MDIIPEHVSHLLMTKTLELSGHRERKENKFRELNNKKISVHRQKIRRTERDADQRDARLLNCENVHWKKKRRRRQNYELLLLYDEN